MSNKLNPKSGKTYKTSHNVQLPFYESAVAYRIIDSEVSDKWDPNVPLHATQEEWWEHFHQIEKENFTPLEDANKEFETWKEKYLANRLK